MRYTRLLFAFFSLVTSNTLTHAAEKAGTLKLVLPAETRISSATAVASGPKIECAGVIDHSSITFEKLLPETAYDVRLSLADGTTIQGVNLDWYNEEEASADAGPVTEGDREEIQKISSIDSFYDKHDLLQLKGSHDREVVLVQFVRDKDFYAGTGQVIWRVELNYFKNQHGGWERIAQQNKIIRRERFKTHDEFTKAVEKIKFVGAWRPETG